MPELLARPREGSQDRLLRPLLPVAVDLTQEDLFAPDESAWDQWRARMDDAYWAKFVSRPFTWRRFLAWWVARKFVVPRDVRRR